MTRLAVRESVYSLGAGIQNERRWMRMQRIGRMQMQLQTENDNSCNQQLDVPGVGPRIESLAAHQEKGMSSCCLPPSWFL
jgi:hypothetical protein